MLTVIDATNVQPEARKPLVELAREHDVLPVGDRAGPAGEALPRAQRAAAGPDFGPTSCGTRAAAPRRCAGWSARVPVRHILRRRRRSRPPRRAAAAVEQPQVRPRPFDIIGDVHGCYDELVELLRSSGTTSPTRARRAAAGAQGVFLGDLVDRGPKVLEVLGW
jgi:protein phosphatase